MTKFTSNEPKNNNSGVNKENLNSTKNTQPLSKAVIDKNNTLVLVEINKFRLMFKLYEKLKKMAAEEKILHSILGSNILKRVELVADVILRSSEDSSKRKAEKLGIKDLENYTKEESNLGIKKYIAVIKEYQRKYKVEVETPTTISSMSLTNELKGFLTPGKVHKDISKEENLLYYWAYEVLSMSPTIRKDQLDTIIEGKKIFSVETLHSKIKEIQ